MNGDEKEPVQWIVLGLGNPGPEYAGTRHNVGFEVVERLAARHGIALSRQGRRSRLGQGRIAGVPVILAEPLTFMNRSGEAARALLEGYGLPVERLVVVVDDVALPPGTIRVRKSGSAGGHNGLESVISHLGSTHFPRVRVGIGAAPPGKLVDYVLSPFSRREQGLMAEVYEQAADAVECIVTEGVEAAMNRFNRRIASS